VRVYDAYAKNFPFKDVLRRLSLVGGAPVLNIIGGKGSQNRSKLYAGIVRACFNTDAVIIDSAVSSGVEKHALRMGKSNKNNLKPTKDDHMNHTQN